MEATRFPASGPTNRNRNASTSSPPRPRRCALADTAIKKGAKRRIPSAARRGVRCCMGSWLEVYHGETMEPIPFAQLMGIEIVSTSSEKVIGRLTVRDEICTRPAVLHGGAAMAFADTLGA